MHVYILYIYVIMRVYTYIYVIMCIYIYYGNYI